MSNVRVSFPTIALAPWRVLGAVGATKGQALGNHARNQRENY